MSSRCRTSTMIWKRKRFPSFNTWDLAPPALPYNLSSLDSAGADFTSTQVRTTYLQSNPKRNYVGQWNMNVQYSLTPNLTAMIAYVGSRGVHQPFRVDEANMTLPTLTSAGYLVAQGRCVWKRVFRAMQLTRLPTVPRIRVRALRPQS